MKLAITSTGETLTAAIDPRFGRAAYLIIYDTETCEFTAENNKPNLHAAQGAGIQAAAKISQLGATHLLTGNCGPKAFATLMAAGIQIYLAHPGTVQQAINDFHMGKLHPAQNANVEGHWS